MDIKYKRGRKHAEDWRRDIRRLHTALTWWPLGSGGHARRSACSGRECQFAEIENNYFDRSRMEQTAEIHQPLANAVDVEKEIQNDVEKYDVENYDIELYKNYIPLYVEKDLDHLYESIYSSMTYIKTLGSIENLSVYEVKQGGSAITILVFRHNKGRVDVMNELIQIDATEITRFVGYMFSRFKHVKLISFHAIQLGKGHISFPHYACHQLEDVVVSLPQSIESYLAMLGSATRKTIRKYQKKVKNDFPSYDFQVFTNEDIDARTITEIFALKSARMRSKNQVFVLREEEIEQTLHLVKQCGLVAVILIDGRICAGSISYRVGSNYFLKVSTHDPKFNGHRLGTLSCFLTICECIKRGGKECHLLWGLSEYKFRFLGIQRNFDNVTVYRSKIQLLANASIALSMMFQRLIRKLKTWPYACRIQKFLRIFSTRIEPE